jgi:hypothetical protein
MKFILKKKITQLSNKTQFVATITTATPTPSEIVSIPVASSPNNLTKPKNTILSQIPKSIFLFLFLFLLLFLFSFFFLFKYRMLIKNLIN